MLCFIIFERLRPIGDIIANTTLTPQEKHDSNQNTGNHDAH